jgi:hypothetical protein
MRTWRLFTSDTRDVGTWHCRVRFPFPAIVLLAISLTACQTDVTPTVTPTVTPPPLLATSTVNPLPPTPLPDDFSSLPSVGISNATAAAQANNAADLGAAVTMTMPVEYTPTLLQVQTGSGSPLNGELYLPDNLASGTLVPGVIVISGQFNDWRAFPLTLREAGMIVLQVETRIPPLAGDVAGMFAALEAQPNIDPERLAILGAESGTEIALQGCAEDTRCKAAGLLTPGDQNALLPSMSAFGGRALWMVVSEGEEDNASALTAEALRQAATGPATLQTYQEAGRGTQMLFSQPDVSTSLVNWLRGVFGG